jgi:hypothetical protein
MYMARPIIVNSKMRSAIAFLALFIALASNDSYAQNKEVTESLLKRIEELERKQEALLLHTIEPRSNVHSFLNDNLTFGGFFESGLSAWSGPDTDLQATNNSNILGINLSADFKPNIRFVSQFLVGLLYPPQNLHNDPKGTTLGLPERRETDSPFFSAILSQGFIEYSRNRSFNIQGGVGYVPFGHAAQQRELVLFVRRGGPQLLHTNNLFSPLWNGLHAYGSFNLRKSDWGYDAYTFTPNFYPKGLGVGGRLWWRSEDDVAVLGLSSQIGKSEFDTFEVVGSDLRLSFSNFQLLTEYVRRVSEMDDPWSFYMEPSIYIYEEEVLFYLFGDYANSSLNETGTGSNAINDPYEKWEYGAGFNWLPTSFTRFRLGVTYNDYIGSRDRLEGQERDYWSFDLSAGVAF